MKPLADWSPDYLKTLYALECEKSIRKETSRYDKHLSKWVQVELTLIEQEFLAKKIEALYRLGTYESMKSIWSKLKKRKAIDIADEVDKEKALIGGIHEILWQSHLEAKQDTPEVREEKLNEVSQLIKELQKKIQAVGEASYEDKEILESILHKRNVEYRKQRGEEIGMPSPHYLKYIDGDADTDLRTMTLDEHMPWIQRTRTQRLGWWAREAIGMSLTDILSYYSERMGDYSKIYKNHYLIGTTKLSLRLSLLMETLYGTPLHADVATIVSTILDEVENPWDKDRVRKIRNYERR
jgi:hypothetical protein